MAAIDIKPTYKRQYPSVIMSICLFFCIPLGVRKRVPKADVLHAYVTGFTKTVLIGTRNEIQFADY